MIIAYNNIFDNVNERNKDWKYNKKNYINDFFKVELKNNGNTKKHGTIIALFLIL